jgi:hypothetical protein
MAAARPERDPGCAREQKPDFGYGRDCSKRQPLPVGEIDFRAGKRSGFRALRVNFAPVIKPVRESRIAICARTEQLPAAIISSPNPYVPAPEGPGTANAKPAIRERVPSPPLVKRLQQAESLLCGHTLFLSCWGLFRIHSLAN